VRELLDRLNGPLHLLGALAAAWLILGSPWIGMYDRMPEEPGWTNLAHVVFGFAALAIGVAYTAAVAQGGRWREYFPWLGGDLGAVGRDLAGLVHGRLPTVESGGLLPLVEGLLLLALLAAGATGVAWFFAPGTETAVALREAHIVAARSFAGLTLLHLAGVALHLFDFVRD
jgi:cytochrome b561